MKRFTAGFGFTGAEMSATLPDSAAGSLSSPLSPSVVAAILLRSAREERPGGTCESALLHEYKP